MNNEQALRRKRIRRFGAGVCSAATVTVLVLFSFAQVFPFWLQAVLSLQPQDFVARYGQIELWPESFHFDNYAEAFARADLGRGYANTLTSAGLYTVLSLVVVLIMGYVLGKKEFRGKRVVFLCLLATMMIPGEVLMVPNYFLMIKFGMLNHLTALFLPGIVNIFGVFLVKQFMNTIPDSVLEAANIDGANECVKIFRIVLPMCLPVIGTYCILTFIGQWNDYLWPMIVLRRQEKFTLQLKLMVFSPMFADSRDQILKAAGLMCTLMPVILVYIVFQRQFMEGISISGLK